MSKHDPNHPRHSRVFELLRQTDTAIAASQSEETWTATHVPAPDFDQIKALAIQSFEKTALGGRATKAGRDNKLF